MLQDNARNLINDVPIVFNVLNSIYQWIDVAVPLAKALLKRRGILRSED